MATDVVMPQMGESIAEGTITKWLVKVGDKVERDQPLFEISTDKVDAEIPSPVAGVLVEILHKEGETVPVSQVVARVGGQGEASGGGAPVPAAAGQPAAAPAPNRRSAVQQAHAVETRQEDRRGDAGPAVARPAAEAAPPAPAATAPGSLEERVRKYSSPLVRKMAAVEGVKLEELS